MVEIRKLRLCPRSTFKGKTAVKLRRCTITEKSYLAFYQPKVLLLSVERPIQNATDPKIPKIRKVLPQIRTPQYRESKQRAEPGIRQVLKYLSNTYKKMFTKERNMIQTVRMQNSKRHCLEVLRIFKYQDDSKRTKDYIDWTKMAAYHSIRVKCSGTGLVPDLYFLRKRTLSPAWPKGGIWTQALQRGIIFAVQL